MRSGEPNPIEEQPVASATGFALTGPGAHPGAASGRLEAPLPGRLTPGLLLALQRTAGNAAVARLVRAPAAPAQEQVRVVERLPTIPEPGVRYVIAEPERRYDFEVTIGEKPLRFRQLAPQAVVTKLRMVWRLAHDDLDDGRTENQRLVHRRTAQQVAGYWSDLFGGVEVPDPDMWNAVGSGPLAGVRSILDATEAELKTRWSASDHNLSPELERNRLMQAAMAFDATEERIRTATMLLERAASDLRACRRRLDEYVKGSSEGAAHAITGIKISIVVLTAAAGGEGAEFAGEGAGIIGKAFTSAGTTAFLGASGEFLTQVGQMRIGEREQFDIARIAKAGVKNFVTAFVGGVVGGKFSQVLKQRLGGWVYGLSDETLAAYGITQEKLLSNAERLFVEWIASIGASPFTTVAGALTDRALDGQFHADTLGDFAHQVLDDMISSGKMGGLLVYGNHALGGHAILPVSGERPAPRRQPAANGETEPATPRPETRVMSGSNRRFPRSPAELRQLLSERLQQARREMQSNPPQGKLVSEFEALLPELRAKYPEFAAQAEQYYAALQDIGFLEEKLAYLWDQARLHSHTVAEELEYILGGGEPAVNEYRVKPNSLPPDQEMAAFRAAIADPRTFVDLPFAEDVHGSHLHAFQEFVGDCLWGPGEGRRFRQRLAELEGTSKPVHEGTKQEYQQPFWSRVWDAMFDASYSYVHAPEVLGRILQEVVDFPRWEALPPEPRD